jgi:hypothetical protein
MGQGLPPSVRVATTRLGRRDLGALKSALRTAAGAGGVARDLIVRAT